MSSADEVRHPLVSLLVHGRQPSEWLGGGPPESLKSNVALPCEEEESESRRKVATGLLSGEERGSFRIVYAPVLHLQQGSP